MSRHVFTREQCQAGGRARALQESAPAARVAGGRQRAAQADFRDLQRRRGRKGAQVTLERYGAAVLVAKLAAWRRSRPTAPEAWVYRELIGAGLIEDLHFWCQVPVRLAGRAAALDFVVEYPDYDIRLVIEPGAAHWHDADADAARDAALAVLGYQVLRLDANLIRRDPCAASRALHTALGWLTAGEEGPAAA